MQAVSSKPVAASSGVAASSSGVGGNDNDFTRHEMEKSQL